MRRTRKTQPGGSNEVLRRRLNQISGEQQSRRADAAVQRVLALLTDENLAAEVTRSGQAGRIELECGILDQIWEDPRLFNRRNQLQRQGVTLERIYVESTVSGRTFQRSKLVITF